jgi:hypothetical protein
MVPFGESSANSSGRFDKSDKPGQDSEPPRASNLAAVSHRNASFIAYGLAVGILLIGGALLRTPILNWISGPFIVVACSALIPVLTRRSES